MPARPRLLVLNQYYAPAFESTAQLLTQLCESLAADHDVTVVTAATAQAGPGREVRNGVRVIRVFSTSYDRSHFVRRGVNYLTYVFSSLRVALETRDVDLVLCMSDPPFVSLFAWIAARRARVPYVAIVQDVFPEIAIELKRIENPVLLRLLDAMVGFGLRNATRVVAIGETMRARLVEKGVSPKKVTVIRNWVDVQELTPQPKANDWSRARDLADKFVVMHSGNVGHAQDLDVLIRSATFLRDLDDVRFVIIGGGARWGDLVALRDRIEATSVSFYDYQPRETLSESLSTGDVHFIGLVRGLAGYIVPSRLNGVLSVARPVIVAADRDSEIVDLVEAAGAGIVIEPGRPEVLAAAIRDVRERRAGLEEMGQQGRRYVEQELDRAVSIGRYRTLIQEVLG